MSSNQGHYGGSQGGNLGTNNPWANEQSQSPNPPLATGYQEGQSSARGYEDGYAAYQDGYQRAYHQKQQSQQQPHQQQQPTHAGGFEPPPGPPPRRNDTFQEDRFVPESERGEQREAMEEFEMRKGNENQDDRNIALLQDEFPSVDGSLVAAIYGDTQSLGPAREMLQELSSQAQQPRR